MFLFPDFIDKPPHFKLLKSFDEGGKSNYELVTGKPICPSVQYFDIFTNDCKKKLRHTCAKSIRRDQNPAKPFHITNQSSVEMQLSPPNKMFHCIKRMGGAAIGFTRMSKELERMEANQAASRWNYTFFLLSDEKIDEFVDPWNESISFIIVPHKLLPSTRFYGFSLHHHFLHGRVCAYPELISQSFGITSDCNVSLNSAIYNINENFTYWMNVTASHVIYAAARCNRFHLASKCSMRVLNSSQVTMKNNSVVEVIIDKKERSYTIDQYLPLPEGFGICLRNEKYAIEEPAWLKHYFFENLFNLSLLAIRIIFEVLLLIVYLAKKRIRNITEKNLIALFFVLLVCDIVGLILPFTTNSLDKMSRKIVAVLLHFFSLALCIWPCIISYQIRYIYFGLERLYKD